MTRPEQNQHAVAVVGISVSGRRLVVSSAAARVTTLNTDPGSNGTDVPRSIREKGSSPSFGGRVGDRTLCDS